MKDGEGRTKQRVWDRKKGRLPPFRSHRSSGKSGWGEERMEIMWFLPILTAFSAGLDLWVCGGTNVTANRCERKYSRHSNEVSLSTMRLGRG